MGQQDSVVVKVDQEIFGSSANPNNGRPCNCGKILRERIAQSLTTNQHLFDGPVENALNETLPNRFDLGQFRHGITSACEPQKGDDYLQNPLAQWILRGCNRLPSKQIQHLQRGQPPHHLSIVHWQL